MESSFQLQSGEKIVSDIKPLPVLKWYFFLTEIWGFGIIIPFFLLFSVTLQLVSDLAIPMFLCLVMVFILYLIANNRYKYQHYWITNKRVLYRRGILGYRISSIPLERISDVIVSRTFTERIFSFGSILIQSLAGQITQYQKLGAEGSLMAIPDPEGVQKLIFDLVKLKREKEKLSF